jgi:hypothetical protein
MKKNSSGVAELKVLLTKAGLFQNLKKKCLIEKSS